MGLRLATVATCHVHCKLQRNNFEENFTHVPIMMIDYIEIYLYNLHYILGCKSPALKKFVNCITSFTYNSCTNLLLL